MTRPSSAARRAAIEEALRQRLTSDKAATVHSVLEDVALLCATCRETSSADAQFCTNCGAKFNASVVANPARPSARESSV